MVSFHAFIARRAAIIWPKLLCLFMLSIPFFAFSAVDTFEDNMNDRRKNEERSGDREREREKARVACLTE